MTTRMVHPDHGAMHAYNVNEIDALKKQGWSVQTPEEFDAILRAKLRDKLKAQTAELNALAESLDEPQKKKPGPKPKA